MHFLASLGAQQRFAAVVVVGVILITGAVLRFHNIQYRTLNHPEVYTPGIDLPWHLTNPNPRFSLWQTLKGTIGGEPHPPGYYIVMLGWTKLFGSNIWALRLPSLLLGVGSILLIYIFARYAENALTAVLAASMLALNGLHLYWSQTARMYSMACFLGLLSTVLLALMVKQAGRQRTYGILYVIFTVAGLGTHVYFWPLFVTQVLWVFVTRMSARSLPGLLRLQIFTFILATPLVAIALYQTQAATRPSTLTSLQGLLRFLQLGALFEIDPFAISAVSVNAMGAILALLATAFLIGVLVLRKRDRQVPEHHTIGDDQRFGSTYRVWITSVAVSAALGILGFAYIAKTLLPGRSTRLIIASSILPIALVWIDFLFSRYWQRFRGRGSILARKLPSSGSLRSLNVFLAVLPVAMVALASLLNPMFIQRGTLLFVPYLLIVIASGLASLIQQDRRWISIAVILAIIHGFSILHFNSKPSNPDYKGLAERWVSQIEDSDLIFVHGRGRPGDWLVAPIFYYLNGRRYRFVGTDFAKAVRTYPSGRVWVLSLRSIPIEKDIADVLAGYRVQKRVEALNISAQLYVDQAAVDAEGEQKTTAVEFNSGPRDPVFQPCCGS